MSPIKIVGGVNDSSACKMIGKWQRCHRSGKHFTITESIHHGRQFPSTYSSILPLTKGDDDLLAPVNTEFAFFAVHHCIGLLQQRNIRILRLLPAREHCKRMHWRYMWRDLLWCTLFRLFRIKHYAIQIKEHHIQIIKVCLRPPILLLLLTYFLLLRLQIESSIKSKVEVQCKPKQP